MAVMQRYLPAIAFLSLVLVSVATGLLRPSGGQAPPAPVVDPGPPVVIDPGHGGIDSGANTADVLEKDINLDTAIKVGDFLAEKGIPHVLTRWEDVDFSQQSYREDLQRRLDVATAAGAWGLVAIHANASGNAYARGFLVLYQENNEESRRLAGGIRAALAALRPDLPAVADVETNHYYMDNSPCPTVIVEVGYLTNTADRAALLREDYRRAVALAIAEGIAAVRAQSP